MDSNDIDNLMTTFALKESIKTENGYEKLKKARDRLGMILEIIKCILLNNDETNDFEISLYKNIDDLNSLRPELVSAYINIFNINDISNLSSNDKRILHLLNQRIDLGSLIIKAKLEIDPNLIYLDYQDFMIKITDSSVESTIIENIRKWSPQMAKLYETYVIPETKFVQYVYANNKLDDESDDKSDDKLDDESDNKSDDESNNVLNSN
jgi:chorismate mutase